MWRLTHWRLCKRAGMGKPEALPTQLVDLYSDTALLAPDLKFALGHTIE